MSLIGRHDGDALRGEEVSLSHCGRCHVVSDKNRMNSIGSTPSFAVLRTLRDWEDRFQAFYVLNPHPAFTQITDVTKPFDATRPSRTAHGAVPRPTGGRYFNT